MYPHERSLVKQLDGKPFVIIGINSDDDRDELKKRITEENISWRSFWNGPEGTGGPISKRWNVKGWPTLYILDAEGVIHYKGHGGPEVDKTIEKLLNDMGHEVKLEKEDGEEGHE